MSRVITQYIETNVYSCGHTNERVRGTEDRTTRCEYVCDECKIIEQTRLEDSGMKLFTEFRATLSEDRQVMLDAYMAAREEDAVDSDRQWR